MKSMIRSMCPEKLTVRESGDTPMICGYFAVFNQAAEIVPGCREVIMSGAFDESLEKNDIRALFNHDTGFVLGRKKAGTLKLSADGHGLYGEITINPKDKGAMDVYERVKRGDISGCSFGFIPTDERPEIRDGVTLWRVYGADTREVSVCTFPAYEGTDISAREKYHESVLRESQKRKTAELKIRLEALRHGNESINGKNEPEKNKRVP